jgi:hypothetical protein
MLVGEVWPASYCHLARERELIGQYQGVSSSGLSVAFHGLESEQANIQAKHGFQQASREGTTRAFRTISEGTWPLIMGECRSLSPPSFT